MTHSADPLLAVRSLATGYGDLRVVWDVSLDVYAGEVTALIGRNGAGKTTTLRAVAGLNDVQGGSIEMAGTDISKQPAHKRVRGGLSYVQEGKRVFRAHSVEENLLLGGYTRRLGRRKLGPEVERMYELFPVLNEKRNDVAGSLSGGQQQMLAIAQALMTQPRVLMLDEPSGGLAPSVTAEVMERVRELKESGLGVLLVEQAVDAAMAVADHLVLLDVGKVVLSAPVSDVLDVEQIKDAYLGS